METHKTRQIGVIEILDPTGELLGIVRKDSRNKNIFYSCSEMDFDSIEMLIKSSEIK